MFYIFMARSRQLCAFAFAEKRNTHTRSEKYKKIKQKMKKELMKIQASSQPTTVPYLVH